MSRAGDAAQEIEVLVALLAEAVRLGDDRVVSIRPHVVGVGPPLLSVEQVIQRIEDLRSLIPEQVPGDG